MDYTYSIYLENFIQVLYTLSSKSFQEVVWIQNDYGLSSSYANDVSDLFDDGNLEKALYDNGVIVFGKSADQALRDLNDVVDHVEDDKVETEIIDSPEMEIVRQKATRALELIKETDGSESSVRFVKVGTSDTPISIAEALNVIDTLPVK